MDHWYCTNCSRVFWQGKKFAKCCGKLEEFDPCVHGDKLPGLSNAWIRVWNKWKDHPRLKEAAQEVYETGNYGASTIFNVFVEHLLEELESDE